MMPVSWNLKLMEPTDFARRARECPLWKPLEHEENEEYKENRSTRAQDTFFK